MSYTGQVKEGVVVFDRESRPPEGTHVQIHELPASQPEPPTWGEVFDDLIGSIEGLPQDMAENHDHYIHGTAKR